MIFMIYRFEIKKGKSEGFFVLLCELLEFWSQNFFTVLDLDGFHWKKMKIKYMRVKYEGEWYKGITKYSKI